MTRKFKDPRRQALADARRQARTDRAPKAAPGVRGAASTREVYLVEIEAGLSHAQVAAKYGVSRQAVHNQTTGYEAQAKRRRRYREGTLGQAVGTKTCSVCGARDHNAGRHRHDKAAAP